MHSSTLVVEMHLLDRHGETATRTEAKSAVDLDSYGEYGNHLSDPTPKQCILVRFQPLLGRRECHVWGRELGRVLFLTASSSVLGRSGW